MNYLSISMNKYNENEIPMKLNECNQSSPEISQFKIKDVCVCVCEESLTR